MSPMSLFSFTGESSYCFSHMFQLQYNSSKTGRAAFSDIAGVNITWVGNTPESVNDSKCGIRANSDVVSFLKGSRDTAFWNLVIDQLIYMGFKEGLTMQVLPYDFRYPFQLSELTYTFNRTLSLLNAITGKKSILLGHSLGVSAFVYLLNALEQAQKDKMVSSAIGLGGPLDGAAYTLEYFVGGKILDINFHGLEIGIRYDDEVLAMNSINTYYQMLPGNSLKM
jgi:Lecithin:cholesterol acyltransferase